MMIIFKLVYVYLQCFDNGEWFIVGWYKVGDFGEGFFRYVLFYIEVGYIWVIDLQNLKFLFEMDFWV